MTKPPARLAARAALVAAAWLLALAPARAERADRDKDAYVTADHSSLDDLHQIEVLTGHVVLIKGTMRLTGERMEHHQDELGYQYYVVTAAPGELATFHERRDPVRAGVESTVDAYGERIEYDDKNDRVTLLRRALVKLYDNGELHDELSGARIVYDGRKETYDVDGRFVDAGAGASGDRVRIRIAPRNASVPAGPVPGANEPATSLQSDQGLKREGGP